MAFSVIQKSWDLLPVVAHPGPPRAIIDNEAGRADARPLLFYTASALEQARLAGYKTTTPDFRQALHCGDSVGIRTQDPQLRRLLLYPTELPNRSVFAFADQWVLRSKVAAKIVIIFGFAIRLMIFLSPWYASLCPDRLSGFALGDQLADDFYAGDEEESDEGEDDG